MSQHFLKLSLSTFACSWSVKTSSALMRMARWIVGICLLRLLGAEPEHHGPFARTTKCLPFKFSPRIWGSKTSKPFNQSTPSCNFMWLRSPNANSIPVFFLLVRTLGKDFDTFIQPGRCKGWMSP